MQQKVILKKKICLLGDPAVGKTSLIRKYVLDKYDDEYISTLGTKVTKKELVFIDEVTKSEIDMTLIIWDVLGQKEFHRIHEAAFQGSKGAFIVCDITRFETVASMEDWIYKLLEVAGQIPIILLANKSDLVANPDVSYLEGVAKTFNASFYLTSAKTGKNVAEAFFKLGTLVAKDQSGD